MDLKNSITKMIIRVLSTCKLSYQLRLTDCSSLLFSPGATNKCLKKEWKYKCLCGSLLLTSWRWEERLVNADFWQLSCYALIGITFLNPFIPLVSIPSKKEFCAYVEIMFLTKIYCEKSIFVVLIILSWKKDKWESKKKSN